MINLSCSIVLYHNPVSEIRAAVDCVLQSSKNIKLYLVDNSSDDNLRYQFLSPQIEYIFNGKNLGYGAGHNVAIKKILGKSRYHLVLNPDIVFNPEILNRLFMFMQQNRNVGMVMPKVLYRNGDVQYLCKRLPSPADLFLRRFFPGGLKFILNSFFEGYELRHKDYNSVMDVPNLSGCFMFIRTDVFDSVGLFDEQYFMYMEDTDLCRRINRYYRTIYYPLETIVHGYSKASYKTLRLTRYHLKSSIKYFNKWGWFGDRNRYFINNSINRPAYKPELQFFGKNTILQPDKFTITT